VVIASTGAGKFVNCVAPNVLDHEGQLIVFDVKGEITAVTSRERRRRGPVFVIDPDGRIGPRTATLNPLDVVSLPGSCVASDAQWLATELARDHKTNRDSYWPTAAKNLLAGLFAAAFECDDPKERTIPAICRLLFDPQLHDRLTCMLEMEEVVGDFARQAIGSYLQIPDHNGGTTRSCILSFARNFLSDFLSTSVQRCLGPTSFPLQDLLDGEKPMTLYVACSASKARSQRAVRRLWASLLFRVLSSRQSIPAQRTLVAVDEAAMLGPVDLPEMYSYGRGMGVSTLTLWQSLSQLASTYPEKWREIIENSGAVQVFGLHPTAVGPVADMLGVTRDELYCLEPNQQYVINGKMKPCTLDKVDYREHPYFNRFAVDPNPLYTNVAAEALTPSSS